MLQTSGKESDRSADLISIVELVNHTRKQVYVCATMLFTSELLADLKAHPPRELASWSESDLIDYRTLEYGVPRRQAKALIRRYRTAAARDGWKTGELPER